MARPITLTDNGQLANQPFLVARFAPPKSAVVGSNAVESGPFENRDCPPARAQADDDLLAALGEVSTWKRQGDAITLIGPRTLRFHLNTN